MSITAGVVHTQMSKILSRKFVILYKLCEDLLSKSRHYDWKLRAIKTTLYVAGGMKRSAPDLTEDKVRVGASCGQPQLSACCKHGSALSVLTRSALSGL